MTIGGGTFKIDSADDAALKITDGAIVISGGTLYIQASGDGIDANGTLTITGGFTTVCGPTQGDTATLDYDVSGVITVRVQNQSADTPIILKDSSGKTILSTTPKLSFAVIILSSPELVKGQTYTLTVGSSTSTVTAS